MLAAEDNPPDEAETLELAWLELAPEEPDVPAAAELVPEALVLPPDEATLLLEDPELVGPAGRGAPQPVVIHIAAPTAVPMSGVLEVVMGSL